VPKAHACRQAGSNLINMKTTIGTLKLKNPVIVASGTFGYGEEFAGLVDIKKLGAIVTKTITVKPRAGNKPPRIFETPSGMLNSIGLENKGINDFIKNKLPKLGKLGTPIIVSIAGEDVKEYAILAKKLNIRKEVAALELNLSCPNVKHKAKYKLIAQDPEAVTEVIHQVRQVTNKPIIAKLSPNVTSISQIAKAAERAGADAISLVNTFFAMSFDVKTGKPRLGNVTGGLSGPAIRPMAVYLVRQVNQAVKIPIIGIGGIMNTDDAIEFFLAGADIIAVGTANFVEPDAAVKIIKGIKKWKK